MQSEAGAAVRSVDRVPPADPSASSPRIYRRYGRAVSGSELDASSAWSSHPGQVPAPSGDLIGIDRPVSDKPTWLVGPYGHDRGTSSSAGWQLLGDSVGGQLLAQLLHGLQHRVSLLNRHLDRAAIET